MTRLSALTLVAGLLLCGCSDRVYDSGLLAAITGDNPPPAGPSPVRGLSNSAGEYPNLASVPPRPTDLSTQEQRDAQLKALEKDRAASLARKRELEEQYKPMTVPPPPNLTPGKPGPGVP